MQEISNRIRDLLFDLYDEMICTSNDNFGRLYHEIDLGEKYVDDIATAGLDIALRVTYLNCDNEDVEISYYAGGDKLDEKELNEIHEYLFLKNSVK